MIKVIIVTLATVIPLAPFVMYLVSLRSNNPVKAAQDLVVGFKGYNVFLALLGLGIVEPGSSPLRQPMLLEFSRRKLQLIHTLR